MRAHLVMTFLAIPLLLNFARLADAFQHPSVNAEMLVRTEWLAAHLEDPDIVVLCIAADEGFYRQGHIPGARLVRLSEIVTDRDSIPNELPSAQALINVFERAGITRRSRIVVYGERSGLLAARAYFTLDYLGIADRAALLDGGIEKWRSERRPESRAVPRVSKTDLQVHLNRNVLVMVEELQTLIATPGANLTLIDARPRAEYTGERHSDQVSHAGHIPGAEHLYWKDLLVEGSVPVLRSPAELQRLFQTAGVNRSRTVVSYCRSGMQSSMDYFVAKYLGYTARMYDASFYEWSRKNLHVEKGASQYRK